MRADFGPVSSCSTGALQAVLGVSSRLNSTQRAALDAAPAQLTNLQAVRPVHADRIHPALCPLAG